MQSNALRTAAIVCVGLLACLSGCKRPGFLAGYGAKSTPIPSEKVKRLSHQQIADVQLSLARSLEVQGQIEPAMKAYREAIEKAPKRAAGYWRLAVLLDRQGRAQESDSLYQQALRLDAKNPDIHCDYGYNLYLQRRWAEAEEHLRQAVAIKPANPRARNNLGLLLAQTERLDEAFLEFRRAGCSEVDAHVNVAFVLRLNQNWDTARHAYHLALQADPESAAARTGIAKLEALVARTSPAGSQVMLTGATADLPLPTRR